MQNDTNDFLLHLFPESESSNERASENILADDNTRALLSIHEAGHSAIAIHLNRRVIEVVVYASNSSYTQTERIPPSFEMLHNELILLLAGFEAAFKYTGDASKASIHAGIDNVRIRDLFADLSISEAEQETWLEKARADCRTLVDRYWSAIEAVAAILVKNYRMNGTDVEK